MIVAARYLNRELVLVLIALTLVLLAVTIGGRFISYLQDAALGKYAANTILTILYYRLPGFLQLLLPFAWFLSVLLTLGRLHADSEFDVLRSGGVGPARLLRWLLPVAVSVAGVVGYFSLILAPEFDRQLTEFIRTQQANAEFNVVTPGIFHTFYRGRRVTYADAVGADRKTLEDVFMAEIRSGEQTISMRASEGGQETDPLTGTRYLVLKDGHRYQGMPGQADYQIVSFGELRQRLEDTPRSFGFGVEAQSTQYLLDEATPETLAELHFRIALPLVVLIGTLVAIGIGRTKPREGRFARMVPGLGLFVGYYAAIVFNRNAISDGQLPAMVGIWLVHGTYLVLGLWLLRHSARPARV